MSLKKALLAATVMSLPVVAQAQPVSGLYVGAGAGVNWRMNSDVDITRVVIPGVGVTDPGAAGRGAAQFRTREGWVGVGSIGWGFGNGIRAEIEGNYRNNNIDRIISGGVNGLGAGGTIHQYGVMGNAFYDFNIPALGRFVPYVGVGAGYVWTDMRGVRATFNEPGVTTSLRLRDREGRFAYQGIVGTAIGLNDVLPGLALTAEYRFFGTLEPRLDGTVTSTALPVNARTVGVRTEHENYNHSLLLGIRYAFNAPRPAAVVAAPAAQPAPAGVARTYLVFFDWDRADLTDRARQIIAEAATNARTARSTRIEVSGHADRSGTPQYNQRLSERRAEAVAAELARRGIQRSEMAIQAFGETRPLVPTADGVREPQNRRVEIVLR